MKLTLLLLTLTLCGCALRPANHTLEAHDLREYVSDSHVVWRVL